MFTYARNRGKLERLAAAADGLARVGEVEEASSGEVIVLSTRWGDVDEVLTRMGALPGVVVVDTINPYAPDFSMALPESTTVAEQLWPRLLPARPVKAFNTLFAPSLDPRIGSSAIGDVLVRRRPGCQGGRRPPDRRRPVRTVRPRGRGTGVAAGVAGPLYTKEYSLAEAHAAAAALDDARQPR